MVVLRFNMEAASTTLNTGTLQENVLLYLFMAQNVQALICTLANEEIKSSSLQRVPI